MRRRRVLVVEDDQTIGSSVVRGLEASDLEVEWLRTGAAVVVAASRADLILLDLGLPDVDGVEVCRAVRAAKIEVPIIMVTARQSEIDVVVGLDAGAVDYVRKPFGLIELLARIRAHLRTVNRFETPITVNDVTIDPAARRAFVGDVEVDLRAKEFDLLLCLMAAAGKTVTREQLMTDVWEQAWFSSTKTLDVTMVSLRRKLLEGSGRVHQITAVRGVGYRYELR